jgi:hypothetical protein
MILSIKDGFRDGEMSICDITTTRKLLQTMKTVFFPLGYHCKRDRTAEYLLQKELPRYIIST